MDLGHINKMKMMFGRKRNNIDPLLIENHEYNFFLRNLRRGDIVFDVGANIGELTVLFSRFIDMNGCVHAFEPTPSTFEKLKSTIENTGRTNIRANNIALSDKIGYASFNVYNEQCSSLNSLAKRPLEKYGVDISAPNIIDVPCETINHYCKKWNIEKIDILKIDVEGAELKVLKGADDMFREKRIRLCAFEFGQTVFDMGSTVKEFQDFFKKNRYRVRNIFPGQHIFPVDEKTGWGCFSIMYAEPI